MRTVAVQDAIGHVLCHDLTRIVKGETKGPAFRKGHVVREEDIPLLLSMGKENLFVWEKQEGFLHENEAALELDAICRGQNIRQSEIVEGKIQHFAAIDGLFHVDVRSLEALNAIDGLIVVTQKTWTPVKKGELLAGMKAIPLVIAEEKLREARAACPSPFLEVLPYTVKSAGIVTTGSEIAKGRINDTFTPVVKEKLKNYGIEVCAHEISCDGADEVAASIERVRAAKPELILCTGGMSVDPDDGTPGAIRQAVEKDGGAVIRYGAPVMPGAMFLLAHFANGTPIAGLPGCVMFAGATIFDFVLPRLAAGIMPDKHDIIKMGHGGLCTAGNVCKSCHYPNCAFGK